LKADLRPNPIACKQSDCGGEIRAGAGTSYSDSVPIEIQISTLVPKKLKCPVTICKSSGEWFLGSESVGNTYDSTLCLESVMHTLQLFRKKTTAKKSTPMKVKQYRQRTRRIPSAIDPHGYLRLLLIREGNIMVFNLKV
jgi:hypothetical protein